MSGFDASKFLVVPTGNEKKLLASLQETQDLLRKARVRIVNQRRQLKHYQALWNAYMGAYVKSGWTHQEDLQKCRLDAWKLLRRLEEAQQKGQ